MFQYSNMIHSPVNEATIKMPDSQHLSASYSSLYHYDPEFYHDSSTTTTNTAWQPPIYPEISPEDYSTQPMRPRTTTSLWDDEGTICYQVDVRGICVARRQDNDMINGTKLLNVTGMSRGKRDGILKNEKGRVVVKVGAMHLKGVWVTFARAKALAIQYSIADFLYPLFVDDPAMYFYSNQLSQNCYIPHNPIYLQSQDSLINTTTTTTTTNNNNTMHSPINITHTTHNSPATILPLSSSYPTMNYPIYSEHEYYLAHSSMDDLPLAPSVPSMLPLNYSVDKMSYY